MLNKLAAGLIAAAVLVAPVTGAFASTNPAAAVTAKTKIVKAHRNHLRHFRIVQCYMTGSQARHVRLHAGKRFQRIACYLPTRTKVAKLHGRTHARHAIKHVQHVKQVRHIKPAKPGHVG